MARPDARLWRGQVEARLDDIERRMDRLERIEAQTNERLGAILITLAELRSTLRILGVLALAIVPILTGVVTGAILAALR